MQDVIQCLFDIRDQAHKYHLKTSRFSVHAALDEFYTKLLEKTDELAETYQGKHGNMALDVKTGNVEWIMTDPTAFINQVVSWMEDLKKYFDPNETHILNIWDEIIALTYRTRYKLTLT